ncbi:hypothetical protein FSP39_007744 [Pinctada imbricata]|uniref:Protein ELYS n=1 Tax=Pinctada imbricata TaxID=66713 RepID=A0AA89C8L3_PINIB|nr:hypothetical protein FSP39_007744 [Pinctada imbricata]
MRPGTTPHVISQLLPFPAGGNDSDATLAGVAHDGSLSWIVRESVLDVLDTQTQQRLASWNFGAAIYDKHSYICAVKEFHYGSTPKLLVGVGNASQNGMLCVLDSTFSKIVKAVDIPHKITSIEVITKSGGDDAPAWALNAQLRQFYGIVAIGTIGGIVYLIDMCLDDDGEISDEVSPRKLHFISPRTRDVADRRTQSMSRGQQLCMVLDEEAQGNSFRYRRCDGNILKTFDPGDVHVSCLKYIPQIGCLVVGFSFGCYQIWKLHIPVLEYSSRLETDPVPITHIVYQEPENDPKNFSYIWTVHSTSDLEDDSLASICLYQLAYSKKTWYSNYGAFYEDLQSVCGRFEMELPASPLNPSAKGCNSSRVVTAYTLEDPCYKAPSKLGDEESFEECMSLHGPDLSLCVFVWETCDGINPGTSAHLAVYDMNRWYHAQMPYSLRKMTGNMDTCQYFSFLSLDEVLDQAESDSLLTVHVGVDKLRRFRNLSPLPPEQYFYPAALAFNTLVVTDTGIVQAEYLGTQRQVLATMQKIGPSMLLNPRELYNLCVYVGLLPRTLDSGSMAPSLGQMRDALLSMALDYNLLTFIIRCISDWSSGEYVHLGCTLKTVLDWAWDRTAYTKTTIDNTCTPLYDWSGISLDQRSLQVLHQSNQRLLNLKAILNILMDQSAPSTDQGLSELHSKLSVVHYIQQHLVIVLWFVSARLLPEMDDTEDLMAHQFSYPISNLSYAYKIRRQEIQKVCSNAETSDVLTIDGLIEQAGQPLKDLWNREGGTGMYPPPSLHALLSIYLLEEPDLLTKHLIVLYVLLDLVSLADTAVHEKFTEKIHKFIKAFSIPEFAVKQIQAFWLLDHKDFEESIAIMLDPSVTDDIGLWQHCCVARSFLHQGQAKLAVRYLNTVRPPLSTPEAVKLKLTILLANKMVSEALEYQRSCRDITNSEDLLHHLFLGCQEIKVMDQLLQLPLYEDEEEQLIGFLTESSEYHLLELLVLHYLQRGKYAEAIQLNDKLKPMSMIETSSRARERAAARNAIIDGFMSVLTGVQRKVIMESQHLPKRVTVKRREVRRPQPLSTTVTRLSHTTDKSKSSLYMEVMNRVQEISREKEITQELPVEPSPRTGQITSYDGLSIIQTPKVTRKITSSDALSLLRTPEVKRRTPPKARKSTSAVPTPQSILKVKRLISANPSPSSQPNSANTSSVEENLLKDKSIPPLSAIPKRLDVSEYVPPPSPRSVSFAANTSAPGTPKKHLRFAAPEDMSPKQTKSEEDISESRSPVTFTEVKERRSLRSSKLKASPTGSARDSSSSSESMAWSPEGKPKVETGKLSPGQRSSEELVVMETENADDSVAVSENDEEVLINVKKEQVLDKEDMEIDAEVPSSSRDVNHSAGPVKIKTPTSTEKVQRSGEERSIGISYGSASAVSQNLSPSRKVLSQFRSPRKDVNPDSTPRSPTVKLTSGKYTPTRTDLSESNALWKNRIMEEQVTSTTDMESPIIDPNKTVEIDLTVEEESDTDRNTSGDSERKITSVQEFSFAPPSSPDVGETVRRMEKGIFRLRRKPTFTFSPPVQVPNVERSGMEEDKSMSPIVQGDRKSKVRLSGKKDTKDKRGSSDNAKTRGGMRRSQSAQKFDANQLEVEEITPRRSKRIYDSFAGPPSAVAVVTSPVRPYKLTHGIYNSLVGADEEIELVMPKITRTMAKAFRGLKSPPSAERLMRARSKADSKKSPRGKDESFEKKKKLSTEKGSPANRSLEKPKLGKRRSSSNLSAMERTEESVLNTSGRSSCIKSPTLRRESSGSPSKLEVQTTVTGAGLTLNTDRKNRSPVRASLKSARTTRSSTSELPYQSTSGIDSDVSVQKSPARPKKEQKPLPSRSRRSKDTSVEVDTLKTRTSSPSKSPVDRGENEVTSSIKSPSRRKKAKDDTALDISMQTRASSRSKSPSSSQNNQDTSVLKSPDDGRKVKDTSLSETAVSTTKVQTRTSSRSKSPTKSETDKVNVSSSRSPGRQRKVKDNDVSMTTRRTRGSSRSKSPASPKKDTSAPASRSPGRPKKVKDTSASPSRSRNTRASNRSLSPAGPESEVSAPVTRSPGRPRKVKDTSASPTRRTMSPRSKSPTSPKREGLKVISAKKSPGRSRKVKDTEAKELTVSRSSKQSISPVKEQEDETSKSALKSPSRRGQRKTVAKEQEMNVEQSEETPEPPMTPTRRSSRSTKTRNEECIYKSLTPTRRSRKKKEDKTKTDVAPDESKTQDIVPEEQKEPMEMETTQGMDESPVFDGQPPASPYHFSEPEEIDVDEIPIVEEESFSNQPSFIFSPPLTRGLSKRLSVEPGEQTSISRRLSLLPDAPVSQQSQSHLSHELELPPPVLPRQDITPRPSIHQDSEEANEKPATRRGRRGRSQTPEVTSESTVLPERAESEPPEPTKRTTRRRKKKVEDEVILLPVPEAANSEGEEDQHRPMTRGATSQDGTKKSTYSIKPTYKKKRKVAKLY